MQVRRDPLRKLENTPAAIVSKTGILRERVKTGGACPTPSVSQAKLIGKAGLPFNSMVTRRALDTKGIDNGIKLQTLTEAALCGVIVLDKPAGWTSHDAVNKLRRIAV